ncbi:cytochrome P450 [Dichotomocladium elegans]|nr:cytochrome P450 [Dichotomocladium elegans]
MSIVQQHITTFLEKHADYIDNNRQKIGIIAGSVALVSLYSVYRAVVAFSHNDGIPLVPYTWPIIGSTREYNRDPEAFLKKWGERYGHVYRVHLNGRIQTVVSGHHVREIFLNTDFDFVTAVKKRFDIDVLADIPNDVITSDSLRRVILKFTNHLKHFTPRAVQYLAIGQKQFLSAFPTEPVVLPHFYPLVQHMVAAATASVFAGTNLANNRAILESFKNVTVDVGKELQFPYPYLEGYPLLNHLRMRFYGKFSPSMQYHKKNLFSAIIPEVIARIEGAKEPGWERPDDVLQTILESHCEQSSDPEYIADIMTKWMIELVFAAVHTTSENSTIVLYRLAEHPDVVEELLQEQKEVLRNHGISPDEKDPAEMFTGAAIKDLVKLDSVCREAMRIKNNFLTHNHTYIGKGNITLSSGAVIKPGEDVIVNLWFNHRDTATQRTTDKTDLDNFHPYRFVGEDRAASKIGDDFLVFGEGKHSCPGRWFALQEMKTIVSFLIRDYKLTPKGKIHFPNKVGSTMPFGQIILEKRH